MRGISVIAVVLFHAQVPGFSGGYTGVDVFFVISGFLITSILRQQDQKGPEILLFYDRRIRRLLPALFCVLFICAAVSAILLLPNELDRFGQGLISTTLFVPNVFFWRQSGYFAPISENASLLHLWSLGVEEQFYLLYPATLLFIRKFAEKHTVTIIAALTCSSFFLSVWAVEYHPSAAFYLAPTRAWELLLGALLSIGAQSQFTNSIVKEFLAIAGLLLIGWGVFSLSGESSFPGLNALLPCLGAALIVHTGGEGQTLVARLLSNRFLVFVGLISYSLYLWHWPLLAFSRQYFIRSLDPVETGCVIVVALLISTLSWKYVERPFRKNNGIWKRQKLFKASGIGAIAAIAIGVVFTTSDGFPQRVSPSVRLLEQGSEDKNPDRDRCHQISPALIQAGHLCRLGHWNSREPDYIVWGDSHADALMPAFKALSEDNGSIGLFASSTSCPPLIGVRVKGRGEVEDCKEFNDEMLSLIKRHESAAVVLVAYWSIYLDTGLLLADTSVTPKRGYETPFLAGLNRTLRALSNKKRKIWLVQQVPVAEFDPPSALAMAERKGIDKSILRLPVDSHKANTKDVNRILAQALNQYSFSIISPENILCNDLDCSVEYDARSLYRDFHHLSTSGAHYISSSLEVVFTDQPADE